MRTPFINIVPNVMKVLGLSAATGNGEELTQLGRPRALQRNASQTVRKYAATIFEWITGHKRLPTGSTETCEVCHKRYAVISYHGTKLCSKCDELEAVDRFQA